MVYFLSTAGQGLRGDFTYDDLMNLYFAWIRPIPDLLQANLLFFKPPPRSLGNLFYALGFHFAGLNAAPYRVIFFAFLSANVYLTYCFARLLTGSREIAAVACLLHSFHGSAAALYYNTGTCYDVFCFFFYFSAFIYYLRIRQADRNPAPWQIALIACLYIAALNSKEMAVTLPVLMGVYELLYHQHDSWRGRIATLGVLGIITAAYAAGITRGPGSLANIPAYTMVFSATSYLEQTQSYLNDLIYSQNAFDSVRSLALLLVLFAAAWLSSDRRLKFCWLFITIGVLPIAFIPPRGIYAVYIPMVGLAIFAATLLVRVARRPGNEFARAGLFVAATLGLAVIHVRGAATNVAWISAEEHHIRNVILQLTRLCPDALPRSSVLFLKDPFEGRVWDSTFLLRLFYRDNEITVDRGTEGRARGTHTYIWTFEEGKLLEAGGGDSKKGGRERSAN
jgi:hypothetical protein